MSNSSCLDSSLDPLPLTFFLVSWLKFWWWVVEVEGGDDGSPRVLFFFSPPFLLLSPFSLFPFSFFFLGLKGLKWGWKKGRGQPLAVGLGGCWGGGGPGE